MDDFSRPLVHLIPRMVPRQLDAPRGSPINAILDENDQPILDENGEFILEE